MQLLTPPWDSEGARDHSNKCAFSPIHLAGLISTAYHQGLWPYPDACCVFYTIAHWKWDRQWPWKGLRIPVDTQGKWGLLGLKELAQWCTAGWWWGWPSTQACGLVPRPFLFHQWTRMGASSALSINLTLHLNSVECCSILTDRNDLYYLNESRAHHFKQIQVSSSLCNFFFYPTIELRLASQCL